MKNPKKSNKYDPVMHDYFYLDVSIKLKETREIQPAIVKTSIESSLKQVFGEIGGQADFDLLRFDASTHRFILRVPASHYVKLRAALSLIGSFQSTSCHFQVHSASPVLLSLL